MNDRRDQEAARILFLMDAPSLGARRVIDLLREHGSAEAARSALVASKTSSDKLRDFLTTATLEPFHHAIAKTRVLGGDFKLWCDPDYPKNLTLWPGRPPVLFYKGKLDGLQERSLALVGRIDPTPDGVAAAARFARKCVEHGISVVSGLAKGIDGASHAAALEPPPGTTYAVLGHGLDYRYPRENGSLYDAIPQNGALISQFRTGLGPQRWTFPARNEVMCTLALGTVIVEGAVGCGSLIQADFSFKHGRPVFILSRNLRGEGAEWAAPLVSRGAHVIEHFDQVLDVIDRELGGAHRNVDRVQEPLFTPGADVSSSNVPRTAVLFDIDGVIVDTRVAHAAALAEIATRHIGRTITPEQVPHGGKPHDALAAMGVANAYAVYRAEYDEAFAKARGEVKVFEDVVRLLSGLRAAGIQLGAVTAQPKRRADQMMPANVRALFSVFLCYNDTQGKKDVGIRAALNRLGVDATKAAYIGDQPTDLEAARKAGVKAVGVLWGFSDEDSLRRWPHDVLVEDPQQLTVETLTSLLG